MDYDDPGAGGLLLLVLKLSRLRVMGVKNGMSPGLFLELDRTACGVLSGFLSLR